MQWETSHGSGSRKRHGRGTSQQGYHGQVKEWGGGNRVREIQYGDHKGGEKKRHGREGPPLVTTRWRRRRRRSINKTSHGDQWGEKRHGQRDLGQLSQGRRRRRSKWPRNLVTGPPTPIPDFHGNERGSTRLQWQS
jgi:hypothetical protein